MSIKKLRDELGLTQEQLAQRLNVSFATVNRWENGQHAPRNIGQKLKEYNYLQYIAANRVTQALRSGALTAPNTQKCRDCQRPATCYDHRDYFEPLAVEPVCSQCNSKRGPALLTIKKILTATTPIIPESAKDLGCVNTEDKTLLIRDVPEDVHEKLRIAAFRAHISMNQFIIDAIRYTLGQIKIKEEGK